LNAADTVEGILAGASARGSASVPFAVSTDQLRAAQSVILANPSAPDVHDLARILAPDRSLPGRVSDEMTIREFYKAVAKASGAAIVPRARFSLLGTAEQFANRSLIAQQRLVKIIGPSGVMTDVAAGEANETHTLGTALPSEAIIVRGLAVDSVARARAIFAAAHSLFATRPAGGDEILTRAFFLSNWPDVGQLRLGTLTYVPAWTAVATAPAITVIAIMRAATGDIEFLHVFPAPVLAAFEAQRLLLASWGGFFHGVVKVIEIVALAAAIGGETIGGLASSLSVVGPIAAAALTIVTLLAIIKLIIDVIMQLVGETEHDKLQRLLDRITRLIEQAKKVDVKAADAKEQIRGLLDEAKTAADEAKETAGPNLGDDLVHALDGALNTADAAVRAAEAAKAAAAAVPH
jgi:hypothetical protein